MQMHEIIEMKWSDSQLLIRSKWINSGENFHNLDEFIEIK